MRQFHFNIYTFLLDLCFFNFQGPCGIGLSLTFLPTKRTSKLNDKHLSFWKTSIGATGCRINQRSFFKFKHPPKTCETHSMREPNEGYLFFT